MSSAAAFGLDLRDGECAIAGRQAEPIARGVRENRP
jgi:hypothetical protein